MNKIEPKFRRDNVVVYNGRQNFIDNVMFMWDSVNEMYVYHLTDVQTKKKTFYVAEEELTW